MSSFSSAICAIVWTTYALIKFDAIDYNILIPSLIGIFLSFSQVFLWMYFYYQRLEEIEEIYSSINEEIFKKTDIEMMISLNESYKSRHNKTNVIRNDHLNKRSKIEIFSESVMKNYMNLSI